MQLGRRLRKKSKTNQRFRKHDHEFGHFIIRYLLRPDNHLKYLHFRSAAPPAPPCNKVQQKPNEINEGQPRSAAPCNIHATWQEAVLPTQIPDWLTAQVKKQEGFAPVAKWDYKQWTNGWGTRALEPHEPITEAVAELRLHAELIGAARDVDQFEPGLPEGVRAALIDLTFNEGNDWMHAGLGDLIKVRNFEAAKSHLLQYDHAGGQVLDDLLERRKLEVSWFGRTGSPPTIQPSPAQPPKGPAMTSTDQVQTPSAGGAIATAQNILATLHADAPELEAVAAIIPGVGPQLSATLKLVDGFEPYIANALSALALANGGNWFAAAATFLSHITPGLPNAPVLSPATAPDTHAG